jgi:hypothetical protein
MVPGAMAPRRSSSPFSSPSFSASSSRWLVACLCIIGPVAAQEKPPAPLPQEAEVLALGARELSGYAQQCSKGGFPARARQAWLEVVAEYAPDDEVARQALGFRRHGSVWQRDPNAGDPGQDVLNAAAAQQLQTRWTALCGKLGEAHRALAAELGTGGHAERAQYHTQRALRFLPSNDKVIAQSGLRQVEGIVGDDLDLAVLQRSRRMDRTLQKLQAEKHATSPIAEPLGLLQAAGVAHIGVKSATFEVYGDWDQETLASAAAYAERALAFWNDATEGVEGYPLRGEPSKRLVFLRQKATWASVVEKHGGKDAQFTIENASATTLGDVHVATAEDVELVRDLSVRWVTQDCSGLRTDAMREGIGHAVVAMFFGQNLVFSVGKEEPGGTFAGNRERAKLQLPDLDTWRELAVEMAWQRAGVPAARLPLLKAAQFPNDARIKAWSFCDYLLRADPRLLLRLNATMSKSRNEADVIAEFQKTAGRSLSELEARWRRFWTEDSPLKKAVVGKTTPLEATSRDASAWLEQLNRVREQLGGKAVGWSSQASVGCKEHVEYLKANKDQRGPGKEDTQQAGKAAFTAAGRSFAAKALVWTRDKEPKKALEHWLVLPGYRDVLLNRNLDTVGIYADAGLVVVDGDRGVAGDQRTTLPWPAADREGGRTSALVGAAVDVEQFGPGLARLLAQQKSKNKQIGVPVSLHFFGGGASDVRCKVTSNGKEVPGVLTAGDGQSRRMSAPGLWAFYPLGPWPRGDVQVLWEWNGGSHSVTFAPQ